MADTPKIDPVEPLPPEDLPVHVQVFTGPVDVGHLMAAQAAIERRIEEEKGPLHRFTEPLQPIVTFVIARYLQRKGAPLTQKDIDAIYDEVQGWMDEAYQGLKEIYQ